MITSRLFQFFMRTVLLRGLPSDVVDSCLTGPRARRVITFRFAYIFASHGPVLVPLLEALSGHVTLRWAMLALGVGSLTMMLAEIPGGMYADRAGPRRALRLGLSLMIGAMVCFFALGIARSLSLDTCPPGTTWMPGVIGLFALEIVMGVALALIHGADTVFFVNVMRQECEGGLDDEAIEATGSAIRYFGTMIAVGIGTVVYSLVEVIATSPAVKIQIQSGVFLLTAIAQSIALTLLLRIRPPEQSRQTASPVTWSALVRAYRAIARGPELFSQLWIYAWTLACALMTVYLFQSPLKAETLELVHESPLFIPLFTGVMILGWWISASGSLLFRSTIALQANRHGSRRQALSSLACLLVLTLLALYPLSVFLTSAAAPGRTWIILIAAALGFLLSNIMRGFFEPLARTTLLRFSRERNFPLPTSLISAFNIAQRAANFIGAIVFSLLLPHMGSENLLPAEIVQRQEYIARALLYTLVLVAVVIMMGILFSQIYAQMQHRRKKISCVVVGSYQEDFAGILKVCDRMRQQGYDILHPPPHAKPVGTDNGFVRCNIDVSDDEGEIQWYVFRLIDQADALIVYNQAGRVGTSTAMEIGYALSAGKPVLTIDEPDDRTLQRLTTVLEEEAKGSSSSPASTGSSGLPGSPASADRRSS